MPQYSQDIDNIRSREYPHIAGEVYLDHAGATLYAKSLVERNAAALLSNLYGNTHSQNASSERTSVLVHETRHKVLSKIFNADPAEYDVVFVANATAALKLIAESSLFQDCNYIYPHDAHTSLVGLRNLAGGSAVYQTADQVERLVRGSYTPTVVSITNQSNFSGKRYDTAELLEAVRSNPNLQPLTIVDNSAAASTNPINLSHVKPDFVAVSFYKIFGLPDLGALLVKKSTGAGWFQHRRYFGGGTVDGLTATTDFVRRKSDTLFHNLEDGTIPFHNIMTLGIAIDLHLELYSSFKAISRHTSHLAQLLYIQLKELCYENGQNLCEIYSSGDYLKPEVQGPILTFNVLDADGNYIEYTDVERLTVSKGIHLRTGGLCNAGSVSHWLGLTDEERIHTFEQGVTCHHSNNIVNGRCTGAVRVSFGAMSCIGDVEALVNCLKEYYLVRQLNGGPLAHEAAGSVTISRINVFPIKSCAPFRVPSDCSWEVTESGLKWDREFCVIDRMTHSVLTLKKHPRMNSIMPFIEKGVLRVGCSELPGESVCVNLERPSGIVKIETTVLGKPTTVSLIEDTKIIRFFSLILNVNCTLGRKHSDQSESTGLFNTSPILCISDQSVAKLGCQSAQIFRANLEITSPALLPYAEDNMECLIQANGSKLQFVGSCRRCNMISVRPDGTIDFEPLRMLQKTRMTKGKVYFGQHMYCDGESRLHLGETLKVKWRR